MNYLVSNPFIKKSPALLLLSVLFFFASCKNETEKTTEVEAVEVVRFDKKLMAMNSKEEVQQFLQENPWYSKYLYRVLPDDKDFIDHLFYLIQHPETRALYQQADSTFGDLTELRAEFAQAFGEIKSYYPAFKAPTIYTTFTGLENDLYVSDSVIIIALEAFIGPKAKYRPDQPAYILRRYEQAYIVPSVIRLLSDSFIESGAKTDMLNDMIYFGKSFEFTKTVMPGLADSLIIALPESALVNNWNAQDLIWVHFIDKSLLYEESARIKEKYIGERPKVPEIGPDCPGRVGQWLGWRIIDKFRTENPDVSFQELMKMKDAQEILRMSKYRGLVEE